MVIETSIPNTPNITKPILVAENPEDRIVLMSINNPNGMKHRHNIVGKT